MQHKTGEQLLQMINALWKIIGTLDLSEEKNITLKSSGEETAFLVSRSYDGVIAYDPVSLEERVVFYYPDSGIADIEPVMYKNKIKKTDILEKSSIPSEEEKEEYINEYNEFLVDSKKSPSRWWVKYHENCSRIRKELETVNIVTSLPSPIFDKFIQDDEKEARKMLVNSKLFPESPNN